MTSLQQLQNFIKDVAGDQPLTMKVASDNFAMVIDDCQFIGTQRLLAQMWDVTTTTLLCSVKDNAFKLSPKN